MAGISVVIITKNEAHNIGRCIRSVQGVADEVLVGDSGSTDDTVEIATRLGARVLPVSWQGYAATKNALNAKVQHPYILSLDADEALSDALRAELLALRPRLDGHAAYRMPRLSNYCGHWVRHAGWYPDGKVRLWPAGQAHWIGAYVHETLEVNVPVAGLQADLLHYTAPTAEAHRRTIRTYCRLKAEQLIAKGKTQGLWLRQWLSPIARFVRMYVLQRGFMDGWAGFQLCRRSAWAAWLKYRLARQLLRSAPSTHTSSPDR
ncbi:MAG: glycosyltransferase family 2 protein [Sphingobacteriia bacterium]